MLANVRFRATSHWLMNACCLQSGDSLDVPRCQARSRQAQPPQHRRSLRPPRPDTCHHNGAPRQGRAYRPSVKSRRSGQARIRRRPDNLSFRVSASASAADRARSEIAILPAGTSTFPRKPLCARLHKPLPRERGQARSSGCWPVRPTTTPGPSGIPGSYRGR
jgi:hypothetical protein